ncbi:hypothetical protein ACRALDRAFT_210610 [Sodiomyces alcalophilus JCM 7366]|uniref:uncharacterized protein n=1 Tax=Sodiomyces alcalophilus JCM 7366 TaxID=591952 RepID=UPI0039B480D2
MRRKTRKAEARLVRSHVAAQSTFLIAAEPDRVNVNKQRGPTTTYNVNIISRGAESTLHWRKVITTIIFVVVVREPLRNGNTYLKFPHRIALTVTGNCSVFDVPCTDTPGMIHLLDGIVRPNGLAPGSDFGLKRLAEPRLLLSGQLLVTLWSTAWKYVYYTQYGTITIESKVYRSANLGRLGVTDWHIEAEMRDDYRVPQRFILNSALFYSFRTSPLGLKRRNEGPLTQFFCVPVVCILLFSLFESTYNYNDIHIDTHSCPRIELDAPRRIMVSFLSSFLIWHWRPSVRITRHNCRADLDSFVSSLYLTHGVSTGNVVRPPTEGEAKMSPSPFNYRHCKRKRDINEPASGAAHVPAPQSPPNSTRSRLWLGLIWTTFHRMGDQGVPLFAAALAADGRTWERKIPQYAQVVTHPMLVYTDMMPAKLRPRTSRPSHNMFGLRNKPLVKRAGNHADDAAVLRTELKFSSTLAVNSRCQRKEGKDTYISDARDRDLVAVHFITLPGPAKYGRFGKAFNGFLLLSPCNKQRIALSRSRRCQIFCAGTNFNDLHAYPRVLCIRPGVDNVTTRVAMFVDLGFAADGRSTLDLARALQLTTYGTILDESMGFQALRFENLSGGRMMNGTQSEDGKLCLTDNPESGPINSSRVYNHYRRLGECGSTYLGRDSGQWWCLLTGMHLWLVSSLCTLFQAVHPVRPSRVRPGRIIGLAARSCLICSWIALDFDEEMTISVGVTISLFFFSLSFLITLTIFPLIPPPSSLFSGSNPRPVPRYQASPISALLIYGPRLFTSGAQLYLEIRHSRCIAICSLPLALGLDGIGRGCSNTHLTISLLHFSHPSPFTPSFVHIYRTPCRIRSIPCFTFGSPFLLHTILFTQHSGSVQVPGVCNRQALWTRGLERAAPEQRHDVHAGWGRGTRGATFRCILTDLNGPLSNWAWLAVKGGTSLPFPSLDCDWPLFGRFRYTFAIYEVHCMKYMASSTCTVTVIAIMSTSNPITTYPPHPPYLSSPLSTPPRPGGAPDPGSFGPMFPRDRSAHPSTEQLRLSLPLTSFPPFLRPTQSRTQDFLSRSTDIFHSTKLASLNSGRTTRPASFECIFSSGHCVQITVFHGSKLPFTSIYVSITDFYQKEKKKKKGKEGQFFAPPRLSSLAGSLQGAMGSRQNGMDGQVPGPDFDEMQHATYMELFHNQALHSNYVHYNYGGYRPNHATAYHPNAHVWSPQGTLIHHDHGARTTESKPRLAKEEVEKLENEFQRNAKPTSIVKRQLAVEMRVETARINVCGNLRPFPLRFSTRPVDLTGEPRPNRSNV